MRVKKIKRVRLDIDNRNEETRCGLHVGYDSGGAIDCTNDPMNDLDAEQKKEVSALLMQALPQVLFKLNNIKTAESI